MHTLPTYVRSTVRRADYDDLVEAVADAIREVATHAQGQGLDLDWTRASVDARDFGASPEAGLSVPAPLTAVLEVEVPVR